MEKWCILPYEVLAKLSTPDNVVLESLARFCKTNQTTLLEVLNLRNTPFDTEKKIFTHYGYKKFSVSAGGTKAKDYGKTEKNKKLRELREPSPELKRIQKAIQERLMQVPISLNATSGPKKSAEKNAERHRYHPYLITLDLKNAFPAVDTKRIYTNLKGALRHALDIWAPLLQSEDKTTTAENKKLFLRALTHLCVSENELPQGAPTSPQLQHIVMSKTDREIETLLPEFFGHYRAVYSRYVDDLAISFSQYPTKDILEEKFDHYAQKINKASSDPKTLTELMTQFENDQFIVADNFERKFVTQKVEELKKLINNAQISSEKKYIYIGQLNTYKQKLQPASHTIGNLKDAVIKAIGNQGRTLNPKKMHTWTPQSNTDREINGLVFDREGKRSLSTKTQWIYKKICRDLIKYSREELRNNSFYDRKFSLRRTLQDKNNKRIGIFADGSTLPLPEDWTDRGMFDMRIKNMLSGIYQHITRVYGKNRVPKEFTELFSEAMKKREQYDQREAREQERKKLLEEERKKFLEKDRGNYVEIMLDGAVSKNDEDEEDDRPF